MSGPVVTAAVASAAVGAVGSIASTVLAPKAKKPPAPTAPIAPPQAGVAPDQAALRKQGQGIPGMPGGTPSQAATALSGIGGVDPTKLSLGSNNLLGL